MEGDIQTLMTKKDRTNVSPLFPGDIVCFPGSTAYMYEPKDTPLLVIKFCEISPLYFKITTLKSSDESIYVFYAVLGYKNARRWKFLMEYD
jgi:hypothetical protein